MAGVSDTDLVNAALRLLGGSRISSLTDGSKNANFANDLYEITRDAILSDHNWNFATKRQKLARSATAPTFEFDYAYVLPSDWLRTVSVHDNDGGHGTIIYREEEVDNQGALLADTEDCYLRYVSAATDVNRMPADFRRALVDSLARDLAMPVANSNTLRDYYAEQAEKSILRAKASDARGSFPEMRPRGSWASSRGGWRTSRDTFGA